MPNLDEMLSPQGFLEAVRNADKWLERPQRCVRVTTDELADLLTRNGDVPCPCSAWKCGNLRGHSHIMGQTIRFILCMGCKTLWYDFAPTE
jgi:hypothetical protein